MRKILGRSAIAAALIGMATMATAAKYEAVDVTDGGKITGAVSAGDAKPDVRTFTISKDTAICGTGTRDVNFVSIKDGMLQDAVVFLVDVKSGKPMPEELKSITINQKKCTFVPYLSVMANQGDMTAVNDDATLHNIHTYEQIGKARRTVLNVSQPNQGDTFTKPIKLRRGDAMKVECDAHDFMHGFVFVAKNPYFAVVDESGHFEIDDVPAGTYKVKLWHGVLGEKDAGEVTVDANGEATIDLSY